MTPARFRECLRQIRWTSIDIVNALQCDLAEWLEKLAGCHLANQPPVTCRSVALLASEARGKQPTLLA